MTRHKCFAFASQPSCLIGTLKDLAPMLRGYPFSIGVISGIDRANSFATHPPDFYGMLGLFVPPALPTLGIVLKLGFSSAWCSGHQLVFDGHVPLSQCRHRGTQRAECRNMCDVICFIFCIIGSFPSSAGFGRPSQIRVRPDSDGRAGSAGFGRTGISPHPFPHAGGGSGWVRSGFGRIRSGVLRASLSKQDRL